MRPLAAVLIASLCATAVLAGADAATGPATRQSSAPEPSHITLKLTDAHPRDVYAAIAAQSGARLKVLPRELWDGRNWGSVDVDWNGVSFWSAVREMTDKTGLGLQTPGAEREMVISANAANEFKGSPMSEHGPFLFVAQSVFRSDTVNLTTSTVDRKGTVRMTLYAEPKLRVLRGPDGATVTQAVDEHGTDLRPVANMRGRVATLSAWRWDCSVAISPPANAGKMIGRLRGFVDLLVQSRSETIEIPDIMQVKELTREVAGRKLQIKEVKRNSTETYSISATISRAGPDDLPWNDVNFISTFRLLDGEGQTLARRQYGGSPPGKQNTAEVTLVFARDDWSRPTGEPARLVWEVPTAMSELTIPFDFRDLPLP